jgi:hypothetical protein
MAQGSVTWLSRLARHEAPHAEEIRIERRRKLFRTQEEAALFSAGEEADAECETLKRALQKTVEAHRHELDEAREYAAHLANRFLFEQARADAWKAAAFAWEQATYPSPLARKEEAQAAQQKAERTEKAQAVKKRPLPDYLEEEDCFPTAEGRSAERVQARPAKPSDGEDRCPNGRSDER